MPNFAALLFRMNEADVFSLAGFEHKLKIKHSRSHHLENIVVSSRSK
jgi:hypothetical protein